MNVIAIWMTARKRPGSSISRRTRGAPRRPSSTSWSTRLRRTDDEGDLGGDEDAGEQGQADDDDSSVREPISGPRPARSTVGARRERVGVAVAAGRRRRRRSAWRPRVAEAGRHADGELARAGRRG